MGIGTRTFAGLLIVALVCAAAAGQTTKPAAPAPSAPRTVFVEAGQTRLVLQRGAKWTTRTNELVGGGTGNYLHAAKAAGAGDFHISARLAIDDLEGSAASFFISKVGHLGFSGRTGKIFLDGYGLGRQMKYVADTAAFLKPGQTFLFEAIRKGTELTYRIDGKDVCKRTVPAGELGRFGFRPWRATMRIREFSAVGTLTDVAEAFIYKNQVDVFVSGTGGYHTYRIPAVIVTTKDTVLAFCEGRKSSRSDTGDIDLMLRRSSDGGKTWSKPQVVWDDKGNTCGNPCPVVDRKTGTIWLLLTWNRGDDHESLIKKGTSKDTRRVYVCRSVDDGATWSRPVEITKTTKHPDWRWYATGPGVGIQLQRGPRKGRMVIPCDHSCEKTGFGSHAIFSDDGGKTWKRGKAILPDVNECQVVELVDGRLMMNMRNYKRSHSRMRGIATSRDGGATWSKVDYDSALPEPICQASFLRYSMAGKGGGKNMLLFSNPASKTSRSRMTVRASFDEGKTWPVAKLIYSGSAAYSCLTVLPDQSVGLLYERDGYKRISFARIPIEWLTGKKKESK